MKVNARLKGDKMLSRIARDDSRVAADVNQTSFAGSMNFEAEAMPHLNDLYRTALHICPQSVKASDVVQETYLRAWIGFSKYRPRTNCKRWLFQILFNVVRLERNLERRPLKVSSTSTDNVISALDSMPIELREALLLVDCQGFSYKETAEILGLSSEVVARHILLGRNHLHSNLGACRSALAAVAH
jgi:RNA polymerase sigma-70 factor (ECF subfamily)